MTNLPPIPQFDKLRWVHDAQDPDDWELHDGDGFVGEVFAVEGGDQAGKFKWHSKITDWHKYTDTVEEAKLALITDYVKERMYRYAMERADGTKAPAPNRLQRTPAAERTYGEPPVFVGAFDEVDLPEFMHYLYLPVVMTALTGDEIRLPPNIECLRAMIDCAILDARRNLGREFAYAYVTSRMGIATPDNPLNRPGWHCDGFGTDDLNYIWWVGSGTRFALQTFQAIPEDHVASLAAFDVQIKPESITNYIAKRLFRLDRYVVHSTPKITQSELRQFVKISLSNHRYNLKGNSHNYAFPYEWPMHDRARLRNDPHRAQLDYVQDER